MAPTLQPLLVVCLLDNAAVLETREAFTEDLSETLTTGANKLTQADLTEEAARLVAADVGDAFSANSLRIAAQSEQAIVGLVTQTGLT